MRLADLAGDVVADDGGREEVAPGNVLFIREGEQRGEERRADVDDGVAVGIVEVHAVGEGGVEERGVVRREPLRASEHGALA